ncbi:hypothetical protein SAMN05428985_103792 [Nocardioides sp. YR527]|uniref:hypothetical protein n=1 Tax=Nocardioides sp. YR527 TaxID=1881028 RepID=UPI000888C75B|nr:hypothetical protein [Nocardioides sp. YR527]SDK36693.1 hypothetical protein SAMN05428985_103792 [Nocardioides sp. YR527]
MIVTGTDLWWDLHFTSGMPWLIEQDRYVGIRDEVTYRRLMIVDVATGTVVRTESFAFQRDPIALAGDFLYTADADSTGQPTGRSGAPGPHAWSGSRMRT